MVSHLWLQFILLLYAGSVEASSSGTSSIVAAKWEFHEFRVHITVVLFLLVMILIKIGFHRIPYVAHYVPESLVLILLGIVFGAIVRYGIRSGTFEGAEWRLTPELFFIYLLPPIVLEASYSLYNRTFGEYLGVVLIFAVLGTIMNFLLIGFAMYGLLMSGALGSDKERFDLKGMLLFSSLVVAVDPVAVLAIFQDIGVELSLYYIVFAWWTAITRIKSHLNAFTLILLAYFSYIMGDCVGWSGIISIIGCGLVQAAYAFHNLDSKSVTLVHKLTKLVAEVSESVIFLFLGVEVLSDNLEWHAGFMLWSLVLCLVARAIVVFSITAIVNAVNVDNTNISITKQLVLVYGGLRGAVAFSLAVLVTPEHLGDHGAYSRRVMITATLFIILFTVGFMGMTLKPLVKLLKIRMQAKRQLSLFSVLNGSVIDETLAGIEIITDSKGRNVVRDLFKRLDEKYIRRLLQREPETYDHKIMRVYERIALRLHFASMQPEKMEVFLEEIPPTLRNKYMHAFQSSVSLSGLVPQFSWSEHQSSRSRDTSSMANGRCNTTNQLHGEEIRRVSRSVQSLNDLTNEFVDNMRSTRKVTIVSHEKRQVTFDESLKDIVESRKRSFVKRFTVNLQAVESPGQQNKSCVEKVDEVGPVDLEQTSVVSTSDNQAVSLWTDNASEDSDITD
ncbi:hypothetical protein T265_01668 [Opisthorchis viverrini]|uniref:Cation/H+ exchanger transmembrane domain-containing protein n=1 Tax=Opisthorchis viverrini TaxID=6198 RepID=A0A074ZYU9_OPIVI|nr:hypothetical protein T265_01668 [Opisthorchis viverrini]KER32236.1 hypothetical protein T265_01668 [Opisthorchis viverrini]